MYVLGLKFVEVAHDMQQQVAKHIRNDMGLLNSYDTWHGKALYFILIILMITFVNVGSKNVAKIMAKITAGPAKSRGVTWFPELVDKSECNKNFVFSQFAWTIFVGRSIRTHLHFAMRNCENSAGKLRAPIDNVPKHYTVYVLKWGISIIYFPFCLIFSG